MPLQLQKRLLGQSESELCRSESSMVAQSECLHVKTKVLSSIPGLDNFHSVGYENQPLTSNTEIDKYCIKI